MKITVKGNTFFVTSAFTVDELNLVAKNRPEALAKKDKDGNELFRIGVGSNSLNNIGISYGGTESDGSKLAMFTGTVSSEGDPKEYLADKYSGAFTAIEEIENGLASVIAEIKNKRTEILGKITIA